MKTEAQLKEMIRRIDGKSYGAYKELGGQYDCGDYTLCIDRVQGDPFAAPSKLRVLIKQEIHRIPPHLFSQSHTRIATEDYLLRGFAGSIYRFSGGKAGSGNSGKVGTARCGQEVLARTAMQIDADKLQARFEVGFPARGRTVLGKELLKVLEEQIPQIVRQSLLYRNINSTGLEKAVKLAEDQAYIRAELDNMGLSAFVANGSVLPRESGVSERPLKDGIPFRSPKELEVELSLPNKGMLRGMGIPKGITLIIGGGYHGKSTLLKALELGVYNHVAGDGREFVITDQTAVKVRAEDGRSVKDTDISLFINNLPNGKNTCKFSTENASGSTSQAANVIEALEAGTHTLLIDEDTSATNFMIRDELMQQLVGADKEPITPFIDRVRDLYTQKGISVILVVGSSGSYFQTADTVIQMDKYEPYQVTEKAKTAAEQYTKLSKTSHGTIEIDFQRVMLQGILGKSDRGIRVKSRGCDQISINKNEIDVRYLEQLIDWEQTAALGYLIRFAEEKVIDGKKTVLQVADIVMQYAQQNGLMSVVGGTYCADFLAMPRKQELIATFNRMRMLRIK